MQRGDFYMDQSRELLHNHLQTMNLHDQDTIRQQYEKLVPRAQPWVYTEAKYNRTREIHERLEDASDSRFRRFFLAMEYKRLSKETFVIARVNYLINQSTSTATNFLTECGYE